MAGVFAKLSSTIINNMNRMNSSYCVSNYSLIQCYLRLISLFNKENQIITNPINSITPSLKDGSFDEINMIFIKNIYNYNPTYYEKMKETTILKKFEGTSDETEKLRKLISDMTHELINNTSIDFTDKLLIAAIVNVVHFSSEWSDTFSIVPKKGFYIDNSVTLVDMIKVKEVEYPYYNRNGTEIVEVPYKSGYVLGLMRGNCPSFSDLNMITNQCMFEQEIDSIMFPKFKIETSISDDELLKILGSSQSDFNVISIDNIGYNSNEGTVIKGNHTCVIEVDEKGTRAAAKTEFKMMRNCISLKKSLNLVFDRPFYFYIKNTYGTILFFGYKQN